MRLLVTKGRKKDLTSSTKLSVELVCIMVENREQTCFVGIMQQVHLLDVL